MFLLVPMAQTVWFSLFDWDGITTATWAGLGNYVEVVTAPWFLEGLGHILVLLLFYAVLPIAFGMLLAAIVGRGRIRGSGAFQTLLFLPQVITPVVLGLAWGAIYAPQGVLNQVLRLIGLDGLTRSWLGDFDTALAAVGFIGTWAATGLCFVLFTAGISAIPAELFDAARMDGAGPIREFFAVTLPGLMGQLVIALTLTVIAAVRTFDLIYVTTRGGPGTSTSVPAFQIYNLAFNQGAVGTGSTVAVVLSVLILALTYLINRLSPAEDEA
ncbi:MAG: sugar ABC transporter permease [Microbacteriaceae bacterium]